MSGFFFEGIKGKGVHFGPNLLSPRSFSFLSYVGAPLEKKQNSKARTTPKPQPQGSKPTSRTGAGSARYGSASPGQPPTGAEAGAAGGAVRGGQRRGERGAGSGERGRAGSRAEEKAPAGRGGSGSTGARRDTGAPTAAPGMSSPPQPGRGAAAPGGSRIGAGARLPGDPRCGRGSGPAPPPLSAVLQPPGRSRRQLSPGCAGSQRAAGRSRGNSGWAGETAAFASPVGFLGLRRLKGGGTGTDASPMWDGARSREEIGAKGESGKSFPEAAVR